MSDEAAELEREAEAARARLADTADQLRARMSPGQMMDEVLNQFRGGDGNQMFANLRTQVRENPMALALVGSGLAWLMMGSGPGGGSAASAPATAPARPLGAGYAPPGASVGEGVWRPGNAPRSSAGAAPGFGAPSGGHGASEGSGIGGTASGLAQGASDALSSAGQAVGDRLHKAGDQAGSWAQGLRDAGSGAVSSAAEGVSSAAHGVTGAVSNAAQSVGGAVSGAAEGVSGAVSSAAHGVSDAFEGVRQSASGLGQQARNGFFDLLEREPLVIGAIGVAVGAAIGALLPATEVEREHLAPAGEALKDKATALVDQGVTGAKEVAAEVYGSVREEADRQGLLPGDTPIAEKIDAVVRAAGETASSAVDRHLPAAGSDAGDGGGDDGDAPAEPEASADDNRGISDKAPETTGRV